MTLTLQVVSLAFGCSEAPDPGGPLRSVSAFVLTGESPTPADPFCYQKQGHFSVCPHIIKQSLGLAARDTCVLQAMPTVLKPPPKTPEAARACS